MKRDIFCSTTSLVKFSLKTPVKKSRDIEHITAAFWPVHNNHCRDNTFGIGKPLSAQSKGGGGMAANGKKSIELFVLTYGQLVVQLLKDTGDQEQVNTALDTMGYQMGLRVAEDFLARVNIGRCADFRETATVLSKMAFNTYLGVQPTVARWSEDNKEFSLLLRENPLSDMVELPSECTSLLYSNILPGLLRGGLEAVQLKCEVWMKQDVLRGDPETEIRLKLIEALDDEVPPSDD